MKLGLMLGYSGKKISINIDDMKKAESLGYDMVLTQLLRPLGFWRKPKS